MKRHKGFYRGFVLPPTEARVPSGGVSPDFSKPIRILSNKKVDTLEGKARQFLLL